MLDAAVLSFGDLFQRFLIYGAIGWCVEVVFTGLISLIRKDVSATAQTYLWMHPIYGLAMLGLEAVVNALAHWSWPVRGLVYLSLIYAVEFASGWLLKRMLGRCPWDYSGHGWNVKGLIRLDYAPAWFLAGLMFEPVYQSVSRFVQNPAVQLVRAGLP